MSKRILILGDSLTLPRAVPQTCKYDDTWPAMLRAGFHVHQVSIGGATIVDLYRQVEYHKEYNPDIVILQAGIVDCAPRALTKFERDLVRKFWGIRSIVKILLKKYSRWFRRWRKISYTSPTQYSRYIQLIKNNFSDKKIIALGIMPVRKQYEYLLPGITDRVAVYNQILEREFGPWYIDCGLFSDQCLMEDHIHLTPYGHEQILAKITERLGSVIDD